MKESCVGAFARGARWLALAAVALGVGAGALHAQATGKIEGRVRDQAGAPIPGAQVRIEGTAFGAVANNQGYYFINNVPAGTVDLRATFVGYRPFIATGLRVLAGQTMTQDFVLEQAPVELEEIAITGAAANPLVPRDEVTTKQRVDGTYTDALPVDRIGAVLALQPGVVASPGAGTITIRGGRPDEAAVYVDGVPVTPGGRGNSFVGVFGQGTVAPTLDVSTGSFEEASVTTGSSSAEFGNAQSGIISIQTRAGGQRFAGSLGFENDEIGGLNHSLGFNRVQASLSGPIWRNLTFAVGGDVEGAKSSSTGLNAQRYPIYVTAGVDTTVAVPSGNDTTFVDVSRFAIFRGECDEHKNSVNPGIRNNYGLDCRGARNPASNNTSYRVNGKLQYTYGTGSRIALSAYRSQNQNRIFDNTAYLNLYNPQALTATWSANNVVTLNWTQNLSKTAERALALETYASYQWDRAITGPLTRSGEAATRDPFGGFFLKRYDFLFDFDNFPLNDQLIQNFRLNTGRRSPFDLGNTSQYALIDAYRNNAYGIQGWSEGGGPTARLSLYREDRAIGKANLDWQVDRYNRVKLGGEFTKYYIFSYSSGLVSQAFSDAYHEKPTRWNAFIEDRLDLGDVVVVGGVRYDWYKTGASRPYFTDSLGNRTWFPRISSMPGFDPNNPDAIFVEDKSHDYLSPHIQVSFPVTDRTNFRLSYAHQVQTPNFNTILGGINTDLSVTNTNHVYGSDLDFGRTITFEFGIRHSFSDDMVLDVSAYNKDKLSDAAGRLVSFFDPFKKQNVDIRVITNADFGNARGIDVRLDRRFGELFNGNIAYTFEEAKNTGSDPFTYINFGSRVLNALAGGNAPPPQAALPTNQNRPHNLSGQLALSFPNNWKQGTTFGSILENFGIFATFRFASGTPYTRCPPEDSGNESVFSGQVCSRGRLASDFNGARLPTLKQFDVRFTKGFKLRGLDLTAYADVRNIFNFENILSVFTTTGDIRNNTERDINRKADLDAFAAEAQRNGVLLGDNSIDLTFGGAGTGGCGGWARQDGAPSAPNCVYMIRAEERFGNGDHIFTVQEQTRASDAAYFALNRGQNAFTGPPRRIRLGLEINF
ncbi:MAG TPA: TonB-dependent receptor [Gemmatimonadales bacterium]|nr:TonB-dependent receptor [Gemmatimonadales bacterium]